MTALRSIIALHGVEVWSWTLFFLLLIAAAPLRGARAMAEESGANQFSENVLQALKGSN
jgi:hypothetical protein